MDLIKKLKPVTCVMVAPKPNFSQLQLEDRKNGFNFIKRRIITKKSTVACSRRISKIFEHIKEIVEKDELSV